ncbi:hypothetical protein GOZ83_26770 [Agrobacterium vitis]|uniref:hypothetical protein n=1 Tax=Rhizobium/Agrobacterium group TaxID=227290 RepID=UPI0012E80D10|nr:MULTISPECIES: hypothetical protein [Rhizobium/Agrobacterium group]MCF1495792.1 hypothetical protein [Allorhizobium ampelinum]MVA48639.1 hypothetical protein [Agrobacterium vitis]
MEENLKVRPIIVAGGLQMAISALSLMHSHFRTKNRFALFLEMLVLTYLSTFRSGSRNHHFRHASTNSRTGFDRLLKQSR